MAVEAVSVFKIQEICDVGASFCCQSYSYKIHVTMYSNFNHSNFYETQRNLSNQHQILLRELYFIIACDDYFRQKVLALNYKFHTNSYNFKMSLIRKYYAVRTALTACFPESD